MLSMAKHIVSRLVGRRQRFDAALVESVCSAMESAPDGRAGMLRAIALHSGLTENDVWEIWTARQVDETEKWLSKKLETASD